MLKVLEVVIISAPLLYNIVSSKKKNDSGEVTLNFKECNILDDIAKLICLKKNRMILETHGLMKFNNLKKEYGEREFVIQTQGPNKSRI